jgi:two-component system cell cycle sensor histidine kinase PleC
MREVTAEMIGRGRGLDPETVSRRRLLGARVKAARERLTSSDTGHRGCDLRLLRVYADTRRRTRLAEAFLVLLSAGPAFYWSRSPVVWGWAFFVLVSLEICRKVAERFQSCDDDRISVREWRARFVLAEAFHGVVWAGLPLLFTGVTAPEAKFLPLVLMLVASVFNVMTAATAPLAVYAHVASATIAALGAALMVSPEAPPLWLFAVVLVAQALFLTLSRRFHSLVFEGQYFRAEIDELISELEQARENSDEARRRAEEASFAKSRFLATMSHELRTPLNAILGFSEVLKSELYGVHAVPAYRDYSADIHASGQHLLALINQILDLSRVESGRQELAEGRLSLAAVARECRHLLTIRAQKRDIVLTESLEDDLPPLWADERAVRQIALNLLTNAVKFTPQGGQVTIKVGWTSAGGEYLSVRDNGAGIAESEIAIVMSSFGRGVLAQKNAEEGSGLGLPIVKGLAELHGAEFILKSKLREGTEAIVIFPPKRVMDVLPRFETDGGSVSEGAGGRDRRPVRPGY